MFAAGPRARVVGLESFEDLLTRWIDAEGRGDAVAWEDTQVRLHDDAAVAMGVQTQTARYQGQDCSGRFLGTLVAVRRDGRWSVVNVQLSRVADGQDPDAASATAAP